MNNEDNDGFKVALKKLMNTIEIMREEPKRPVFTKSLEWDIGETWMRDKMEDYDYATKVYNALCNVQWQHVETKEIFHCSWRYAGGIVAQNRRYGEDYMEFYASGGEGALETEVVMDFAKLGWINTYESPELSKEAKEDLSDSSELLKQINEKKSI